MMPLPILLLVTRKRFISSPSQLADLYRGLDHINVRSAAYPQGELRGQLNNRPVLRPAFEGLDTFDISLNAPGNINYQLQVSTNLADWYAIDHAIFGPGPGGFTDQHDPREPYRFYRVKVQ